MSSFLLFLNITFILFFILLVRCIVICFFHAIGIITWLMVFLNYDGIFLVVSVWLPSGTCSNIYGIYTDIKLLQGGFVTRLDIAFSSDECFKTKLFFFEKLQ